MSAPPTGVLFYDARAKPLSTIGTPQPGAYYQFYLTQTLTQTNVYADGSLTTPLSQTPGVSSGGTTAASDGRLVPIYLDPAITYRYQLYSATAVLLEDIDPYIPVSPPSQEQIGQILYPQTAREIAAGITPTKYHFPEGNVLRYGADPSGIADSTNAFNQATFANFSPITAPSAYKDVYVPNGQYLITSTVYVPAGTILHGDGMSTYIDASSFLSTTADVFKLGWSLIAGVPIKDTIYLTGGYPPEVYGLFVNGGPASASVVNINYPGAMCHDIWFSEPGQACYLAGGYFYDCEVDGGLTGMTVGPGINQTVSNVRFFNQNTAVNFDVGTDNIDTCIFSGCTIEYPKITGVVLGSGTVTVAGIQFVGCSFNNNPASTVTSFANCINISNSNTKMLIQDCAFNNWGQFNGSSPTGAIAVAGANAVVDIQGCVFDGAKTNPSYTLSTTAAGIVLTSGTVRMSANHFRNLPFGGGVLFMSGSGLCSVKIDGLIYDNVASTTAVNISNTNASSIFVASNVDGDGVTPFINPQAVVATTLKNMSRWFGGIGTSGSSNFVTVPYQESTLYQIALTANQNNAGSVNYRKSRMDFVEKDNEFATSAKSFLVQSTAIQGAANTNGTLTLTVEFGSVGGGTTIASSQAGVLAISWPTTYNFISIDVQVIQSG